MICSSEFATVLFPVSTTWMMRKLPGLSQEDNRSDPNDWRDFSQRTWKWCCFSHLTYTFPFKIWKGRSLCDTPAPPSLLTAAALKVAHRLNVVVVACICLPRSLKKHDMSHLAHSKTDADTDEQIWFVLNTQK